MYKEDSVLNNLQWLICHKTKPNHIYLIDMYKDDSVLNNLQRLICHKNPTNQPTRASLSEIKLVRKYFAVLFFINISMLRMYIIHCRIHCTFNQWINIVFQCLLRFATKLYQLFFILLEICETSALYFKGPLLQLHSKKKKKKKKKTTNKQTNK